MSTTSIRLILFTTLIIISACDVETKDSRSPNKETKKVDENQNVLPEQKNPNSFDSTESFTPPVAIGKVEIAPKEPSAFSHLDCTVENESEIDLGLKYNWQVNGNSIAADQKRLSASEFRISDQVSCSVSITGADSVDSDKVAIRPITPSMTIPSPLVRGAVVFQNHLYALTAEAQQRFLTVWDISQESSLKKVDSIPIAESSRLEIVENILYRTAPGLGVELYDLTNPAMPSSLGTNASILAEDNCWVLRKYTQYLLCAQTPQTVIVDVSKPKVPKILATIPTESSPFPIDYSLGATIDGNMLFVSGWYWGVKRYDISDPLNPVQMQRFEFDLVNGNQRVMGWDSEKVGDTLFTAGNYSGIRVYDVSDLNNPQLLSSQYEDPTSTGGARRVKYVDNYVIARVYDDQTNLQTVILNVENPRLPKEVERLAGTGVSSTDIWVSREFVVIPMTNETIVYRR